MSTCKLPSPVDGRINFFFSFSFGVVGSFLDALRCLCCCEVVGELQVVAESLAAEAAHEKRTKTSLCLLSQKYER